MTSSPTVTGYIISCLTAHLSAGSLTLRHLCAISWERKHTHTQGTRTHLSVTVTLEHRTCSQRTKLPTAGGDSFFFFRHTYIKAHTHDQPLAVWRIFLFWCPWWCSCPESPPPIKRERCQSITWWAEECVCNRNSTLASVRLSMWICYSVILLNVTVTKIIRKGSEMNCNAMAGKRYICLWNIFATLALQF